MHKEMFKIREDLSKPFSSRVFDAYGPYFEHAGNFVSLCIS